MFTPEEILNLKIFCQGITTSPRPIESQVHSRIGPYLWCDDWEIIEILKYLFNGKAMYYEDPPPNRLKNNTLWSKENIEKEAEKLISELKTAEAIINYLKQRRTI